MRQYLRLVLLCLVVAFVGGTMIGPLIAIKGVAPDFTIIALVILALAAGPGPGSVGGFLLGLVQDLSNPTLLGLQALCKTGLGFGLGRLRGRLVHGMPLVEATVVAITVVTHDLFFLMVQSSLTTESNFLSLFTRTLPIAVYSGLAGVPLLRLAEFLGILRQED
ncbi:MAG: rod shape-determining protein MreD [Candidatus Krumholzibacteria bacterium]|nr:rod shape-determining protein MreD [Candidatus Krumholzibacteria bacterium]